MALTFDQVKTMYANGRHPETLECQAVLLGIKCQFYLDRDVVRIKIPTIFRQAAPEPTTAREIRDLIYCLICSRHQENYVDHVKMNLQRQWSAELPDVDFQGPWHQSRYSLGRNSTPRSPRTPSAIGNASDGHGMRNVVASPRSHRARHESSVSPTVRDGDSGRKIPPTIFVNGVARSQDQDAPRTPPATRKRQRTSLAAAQSDEGQRSTQFESNEASSFDESPQRTAILPDRQSNPLVPSNRFEAGEASAWAPWTIRAAVLDVLSRRTPHPKDTGTIYVVRVNDLSGRSRVKIGITTEEKWGNRISAVARTHAQTFHMTDIYHRSNIPVHRLGWLEELVHATLACFQRNWCVRTDGSWKTHREYFEIDFHIATNTVKFWIQVLNQHNVEPGAKLDPAVLEALAAELDGLGSEPGADVEAWRGVNGDHELRLRPWRKHLLREENLAGVV